MSKVMKNGVEYYSLPYTPPVKALLQVQYNALTTAEKNNGTMYLITDADPPLIIHKEVVYGYPVWE